MKRILVSSVASVFASTLALCLAGCPDDTKPLGAADAAPTTVTPPPSASATATTTATAAPSASATASAPGPADAGAPDATRAADAAKPAPKR